MKLLIMQSYGTDKVLSKEDRKFRETEFFMEIQVSGTPVHIYYFF
jgi:hypothetical protein